MFRLFLISVVVLLIAACTPAEQQAHTISSTMKSAVQAYNLCAIPVYSNPEYAPLAIHFPLQHIKDATLEQMASVQLATPQEGQLLYSFRDSLKPCSDAFVASVDSVAPTAGAPFQNYYDALDQGIILLAQDKITWGTFVSVSIRNRADALQASQQALNEIGQQLQEENDIETAQRAQALQNFADYEQRQQAIDEANREREQAIFQANRPVTTNCNSFGTQTSCTSY